MANTKEAGRLTIPAFERGVYYSGSTDYDEGVCVIYDTSNQDYVKFPTEAGEEPAGIAKQDIDAATWNEIQTAGKAKCLAGESLSYGDYVMIGDTSGQLIKAFPGCPLVGRALQEAAGAASTFEVELMIGSFAPMNVVQEIAAATGTVNADARYVVVDYTTTGTATITLPSDRAAIDGQLVTIIDEDGNANSNNISLTTEGSETINGGATYTMDADNEAVTLVSYGGNWEVASSFGE